MGEEVGLDDGTDEQEVPSQDAHEALLGKWGLVPPTPETGRRHERSAQLSDDPKLRDVRRHIGLESRAGWRRRASVVGKSNRPRTGELGTTLGGPGFRTQTAASSTLALGSTMLLSPTSGVGSVLPTPVASATLQGTQNFVTQPASAMTLSGQSGGRGLTRSKTLMGGTAGNLGSPMAKTSASSMAKTSVTSLKRSQTQSMSSLNPVSGASGEDALSRLMGGTAGPHMMGATAGRGLSRTTTQPCLAGTLRLDSTTNMGSTLKLGATGMLPSLLEEVDAVELGSHILQEPQEERGDAKQQYRAATNAAIQRLLEDIQLARGPLLDQNTHGMVCDRLDNLHDFYSRFGVEPKKVRRSPAPASPQFLTYDEGAPAPPGSLRGRDVRSSSISVPRQQRGQVRSRSTNGVPAQKAQARVQQPAH